MNRCRLWHGIAKIGRCVYAVLGRKNSDKAEQSIDKFDVSSREWSLIDEIEYDLSDTVSVAFKRTILSTGYKFDKILEFNTENNTTKILLCDLLVQGIKTMIPKRG